jgi:hypothetical protein
MKRIGNKGKRMHGIAYRITNPLIKLCISTQELMGETNIPTINSRRKKAVSMTSRIIILFDFERAIADRKGCGAVKARFFTLIEAEVWPGGRASDLDFRVVRYSLNQLFILKSQGARKNEEKLTPAWRNEER